MTALKVLTRCSQTSKSALGPLGYLFVALPPEHYIRFTTVAFVPPTITPALPTYTAAMLAGEREQQKLTWQAHKAENENIQNMNEALAAMFLDAISPTYKKSLDNDLIWRTATNFWDIFQYFLNKYGKIKPMDIEANNKLL